jgi:hypothetical protein
MIRRVPHQASCVSPQLFSFENVDNIDITAGARGEECQGGAGRTRKEGVASHAFVSGSIGGASIVSLALQVEKAERAARAHVVEVSLQKRGISVDMQNSVLQGVVSSRDDNIVGAEASRCEHARRRETLHSGGERGG